MFTILELARRIAAAHSLHLDYTRMFSSSLCLRQHPTEANPPEGSIKIDIDRSDGGVVLLTVFKFSPYFDNYDGTASIRIVPHAEDLDVILGKVLSVLDPTAAANQAIVGE
jgi:hypothetical protein